MSLIGTIFFLSMMSKKKDSTVRDINVVEQQNTLDGACTLNVAGSGLIGFVVTCVATVVCIYFFLYREKRKELKDAINNLVYYNTTHFLLEAYQPQRCEVCSKRNRIERRIEVLEEEPAFFGSPLYIAKSSLKKEIKSKLDELKIELENLEKEVKN